MKKLLIVLLFLFQFYVGQAHAFYIIDGDASDWGVNLNTDAAKVKGYLDTNTPSVKYYFTEDNTDNSTKGHYFVDPGYSIQNIYDAEAMYFANDDTNLYIAIITGVSPTESIYPSGDIFLDLGYYQDPESANYRANRYQFGIDINNGKLYNVDSWQNTQHYSAGNPWKMGANKTFLGDLSFVYGEEINSHYVIETAIPIAYLTDSDLHGSDVWLHWTMKCGNDVLNLKATVTPEPATISLFLSGLFGLFAFKRKS